MCCRAGCSWVLETRYRGVTLAAVLDVVVRSRGRTHTRGGGSLGVIVIVLLLVAWAIVLLPTFRLPRFESSPIDGVKRFEKTMGAIASTRVGAQVPGRWVMVPSQPAQHVRRRRNRVIRRRRQNFMRLVFASGATLLLGLIPALRGLLAAHLVIDAVLAVYVMQLRRWATSMRDGEKVHRLPDRGASERLIAQSG